MSIVSAVPNLTREAARARATLLRIESYDVVLDLTDGVGNASLRTFQSTSRIRFSAARAGGSTYVDVVAAEVASVTLNGRRLNCSDYDSRRGIQLDDLALENVLVVVARMLFTNTGEGLHRFVDPLDDEVYLYSQFETADAKRMYACFDQPDLKAEFTFHVTAPSHWRIASNSSLAEVEQLPAGCLTHFATTPRISPYVTAIVAGPYHVVRDRHGEIDLGLWCRRTMAPHLDVDELFEVTKRGLEWYQATFDVPYPFDKYDQLFVPEFNAGAMENAGCVTFNEAYLFRGRVTDARHERRAETILHEMAHMWFGDLVTLRWWDDLWLNESFASYAAALCATSATQWRETWTAFAHTKKAWAYRQDQLPTTHPIAMDAPDVETAEVNFDGITYAKGASVLKQLGAYVGLDAFLAGVHDYFVEHAYGNTSLADLLISLEKSSGRDLRGWSKAWLETAGINTVRSEFTVNDAGAYTSFEVVQTAPSDMASTNTLRPHRVAIGLYDDQDGRLVRRDRLELNLAGERTAVPELLNVAQPAVLLVNDDDLTYCKLSLDSDSLATVMTRGVGALAEPLPRALCWSALWEMTRDGELAARDYLQMVFVGADDEDDIGLMQSLVRHALWALEFYAEPGWANQGYSALADGALAGMRRAEPGSDRQLVWAQTLLGAAQTDEQVSAIRSLLDGTAGVSGLVVDLELRWAMVQTLSAHGQLGLADISAELARDPSSTGERRAATARALQPTPEAKAEAWRLGFDGDHLPNSVHEAVVAGFSHHTQGDLVAPYVEPYFASIGDLWQRRTSELAQKVVTGMFPLWSSTISDGTVAAAEDFLARNDVPAPLRRLVIEGRSDVVRAQRARMTDARRGREENLR